MEIINKLLLLHLFGCLRYCINDARSHKYQICVIILAEWKNNNLGLQIMPNYTLLCFEINGILSRLFFFRAANKFKTNFNILLTVHLNIFIS